MRTENKYGYKVCYREKGKIGYKVHLVTNRLEGAVWNARWFEIRPQKNRKDNHLLKNPKWQIFEIKTKKEYEKLWKGCPF